MDTDRNDYLKFFGGVVLVLEIKASDLGRARHAAPQATSAALFWSFEARSSYV